MRTASLLLLLAACSGDDAPMEIFAAVASFEPPAEGPLKFGDVPFPSDLYLGDDGTLNLASLPTTSEALEANLTALDDRRGFCRSCAFTFPIEGELDPQSVPDDAEDNQADASDPIVLMRMDAVGGFIPLDVEYSPRDSAILVRPHISHILAPQTKYVVALTDSILADDGSALAASPTFAALEDGSATGPVAERARTNVEDALSALETAGVERQRVVSVAAFTTDDGSTVLRSLRAVVEAATVPMPVSTTVLSDAAGDIDGLLGVPGEDRPGIDVRPADGEAGSWAIVHDAIETIVLGAFETPRVVDGTGTDTGALLFDADGNIGTGPTPESVPFVLAVPRVADRSALPVVVIHHGTPSSSSFGLFIANTFAQLGMAVLTFDAFQHGFRTPSARDERNVFRDLAGPDGFAETDSNSVVLRLAGLADDGIEFARTLGAAGQHVVDTAMAIRMLREGDFGAVAAAAPELSGLGFDSGQVYFLGQSFGAFTGMNTLPITDGVQAAVLSVGPPDRIELLCVGPENRMTAGVLLELLLEGGRFDEVDRRLCMNPALNLGRWLLEPLAPMNTLHYLFDEPLSGAEPPDALFLYVTLDRNLGVSGEHVIGAARVRSEGRTYEIAYPRLDFPASANRETPNGPVTAGAYVYQADHSLLRRRVVGIEYEAPFVPPFVALETPRAHDNPIEAVHEQMTVFFESRLSSGRAQIIDPLADR